MSKTEFWFGFIGVLRHINDISVSKTEDGLERTFEKPYNGVVIHMIIIHRQR